MPDATTRRSYPFGVLGDDLPSLLDIGQLAQAVDNDLFAAVTGTFAAHACLAYRSGGDGDTGNVADSTWTAIGFPSEQIDTDGYHVSSPNSRITVPTGLNGYYLVGGMAHFAAATGGQQRGLGIDINNSGQFISQQIFTEAGGGFSGANGPTLNLCTMTHLNDGDYVQLSAYQDSGSGIPIRQTFTILPNFWVFRIPFFA